MMRSDSGSSPSAPQRIGNISVRLTPRTYEDLLSVERFDAIVSSDDVQLSMGGGVSAVLRRLGGAAYVESARALVPLRVGDVVTTVAGDLPSRYVFHAATVDWGSPARPTERTIRQILRAVLARCENLRVEKLLIPAVGAGTARFPTNESLAILQEVLETHVLTASVLREIVLSVPRVAVRVDDAIEVGIERTVVHAPPRNMSPPPRPSAAKAPAPARSAGPTIEMPLAAGSSFRSERGDAPGSAAHPPWWRRPWFPRARERVAPHENTAPEANRPVLASRYVLLEELGRGGFGVVHLSWDLVLRRTVAIKRLRRREGAIEGLRREALIGMDLTHDSIVRVHHFEHRDTEGGPFIVMEYLPWPTAEKWAADAGDTPPAPGVVAELGVRACRALSYAHHHQVLHLDIKPSNLFVDAAAEEVKLADFGLAQPSTGRGRAMPMVVAGTAAYMAPEQFEPGRRLTPATDLYQLSATLWDLATGQPPPRDMAAARAREEAQHPLSRVLRGILMASVDERTNDASLLGEALAGCV